MRKKLIFDLKNCYGINSLNTEFIFNENEESNFISIYAPNGTMKSSLAKTVTDTIIYDNYDISKDKINSNGEYKRNIIFDNIKIENLKENILVINSFDYEENKLEASILLIVDDEMKEKYTNELKNYTLLEDELLKNIYKKIENKKIIKQNDYINIIKTKIGTIFQTNYKEIIIKNNLEKNLALMNLELSLFEDSIVFFKDTNTELIFSNEFNNKIIKKNLLTDFIKYMNIVKESNQKSALFSEKINIHNFQEYIQDKKIINLSEDWSLQHKKKNEKVNNIKDLEKSYIQEKDNLFKNIENEDIYIKMNKITKPFENILKNFNNYEFLNFINQKNYSKIEQIYYLYLIENEKKELEWYKDYDLFLNIEEQILNNAKGKVTLLEKVINIFNNKFDIPVKVILEDREDYIIGKKNDNFPKLKLIHKDNEYFDDEKVIYSTLSSGEKKALYLLKNLFKIEYLKLKNNNSNLIIIDDLSETFDYRNKHFLLLYLCDLQSIKNFHILSMTHNFDFFRSLSKRLMLGSNKYIANKDNNNIQIFNYKENLSFESFFNGINSESSFLAAIPILRENKENKYDTKELNILTNLLHYKNSTSKIKNYDILNLKIIKDKVFDETKIINIYDKLYLDTLNETVNKIINETIDNKNIKEYLFVNKIILCMSIRIQSEKILKQKLSIPLDDNKNEFGKLFANYKLMDNKDLNIEKILQEAVISVPEIIHIHSEDYSIIIDLSFNQLKDLYCKILKIN